MPEVAVDSAIFGVFLTEVVRAVSVKAGQLCTNIRRVLVREERLAAVSDAVRSSVANIVVGDPGAAEVKLGPLVHQSQRSNALEGIATLQREARTIAGGNVPDTAFNADPKRGAFLAPTVLAADRSSDVVHEVEVFAPVVTLLPYRSIDDAIALCRRGGGSLVASLYGEDRSAAGTLAIDLASHHGRVLVVDPDIGPGHTGHAIVMPQCVHGGPGRAGGGEELGGLRGLRFYMQRTALQASTAVLKDIENSAISASL
jgi:3,4-dehydroadipyl-CoA semialdehyde dehydrogenase